MKLSAGAEYSVQAVTHLAQAYGNGPVPLSQLAEEEGIPLPFLEQLMMLLRRKGLVTSARGARGGYFLAKDPAQISVADIVTAVEGPFIAARNTWALVQEKVLATLNSLTLGDLCQQQPTASRERSPARQPAEERTSMVPADIQVLQDLPITVERKEILKANSVEIKKSEVRAVMRPNRSGKSSSWWRKACPKCGGDMYQDPLLGQEWELDCLQCGHIVPRAQAQAREGTNSRAKGDSA